MTSQPGCISVTKTPDNPRSKVGDTVTYTIKICNTGGSTVYLDSVMDTFDDGSQEDLTAQFPDHLDAGDCATAISAHVVQPTTSDTLNNTVTVSARVTASDTASISLFKPSVTVTKSGPQYSKPNDTVTYTYTITNTSSAGSPDLILNAVEDESGHFTGGVLDSVIGDLTETAIKAGAGDLGPNQSVQFTATYTVQEGDPDPLVNTVTVNYHPDGFPNLVQATASWSVDLVHPRFEVSKTCESGPIIAGPNATATFRVNVHNTGDVPLNIVAVDKGVQHISEGLAPGSTFTFTVTTPVTVTSPDCTLSASNTVDVTITLPQTYGLDNTYHESVTATCPVVILGKTLGFWGNKNGRAILDPDKDGDIEDGPFTLGKLNTANLRGVSVGSIANSDAILSNDYCTLPGSNCTDRSDSLQQNTLETLMAQTLALTYNTHYIACFGNQFVSSLKCSSELAAAGLPADSTIRDVLTAANLLIANSLHNSTSPTTQAQAGAMNALLGCLNRETF